MSKEHELPSDSDEDDEDYVPGGVGSEVGSEVESDSEAESCHEDDNDEHGEEKSCEKKKNVRGKKRGGKGKSKSRKKLKIKDVQEPDDGIEEAEKKLTEEEEKKRADSLWADFMKDAPVTSRQKSTNSDTKSSKETSTSFVAKKQPTTMTTDKIKITKVFEFAGEEVKVEKEVAADSAEARLSLSSSDSKSESLTSGVGRGRGMRRGGGLGGISSVLGQIGKKAKISTLEKSKLDWDSYKKEKNIEEEISTHNKGKDGYLERQDFLQRADIRQFEIEKQLRSSRRSNR